MYFGLKLPMEATGKRSIGLYSVRIVKGIFPVALSTHASK